jgi:hypothetical protein
MVDMPQRNFGNRNKAVKTIADRDVGGTTERPLSG